MLAARLTAVLLVVAVTVAAVPNGNLKTPGCPRNGCQRITHVIQWYIDAKQISRAITVVARRGRVALILRATGLMDIEHRTPMRKDAIFRMASMSKPVTGVAILMLVEEGKVRLGDQVSRFIHEFKGMKVTVEKPLPSLGRRFDSETHDELARDGVHILHQMS